MSLALSADYMFNLSAFTVGYNSDRLFDLIALGGVYAGVGNSQKKNEFVYGVRAGVQGRFNVSSGIDLFIEPQLLASRVSRNDNGLGFDPEACLMVGLNYKLGGNTVAGGKRTFDKRNYFSVSVGPSLFSETI